MNSYRLLSNIFFGLCCTFFIIGKSFAEPTNIHTLRKQLRNYYESGQYIREISSVANAANSFIDAEVNKNKKSNNPKKLAVVLDIDETSLSYYKNLSKRHFCYNAVAAREEILTTNAPAIEPILNLYKNAIKHNVSVFFITARRSYAHQATIRNLKVAGYTKYEGLYTRPAAYKKNSIKSFKAETRGMLESKGYTIIATIGDQISDLEGGHAKKAFKIPNPYYYIS